MNTVVSHRTRQFARVIGPFLTIVVVAGLIHAGEMRQLLSDFTQSDVWPWFGGAVILVGGLSIVAFHQIWRGIPAIIVSALGWLLVLRGALLLLFPGVLTAVANWMIDVTAAWIVGLVVTGLVGLYLSYVGWKPRRSNPHGAHLRIDIDLPDAA